MLFKKERCYQLQPLLHITQVSLFYARAFSGVLHRQRVWRPGFHPSSTSYELLTLGSYSSGPYSPASPTYFKGL